MENSFEHGVVVVSFGRLAEIEFAGFTFDRGFAVFKEGEEAKWGEMVSLVLGMKNEACHLGLIQRHFGAISGQFKRGVGNPFLVYGG